MKYTSIIMFLCLSACVSQSPTVDVACGHLTNLTVEQEHEVANELTAMGDQYSTIKDTIMPDYVRMRSEIKACLVGDKN